MIIYRRNSHVKSKARLTGFSRRHIFLKLWMTFANITFLAYFFTHHFHEYFKIMLKTMFQITRRVVNAEERDLGRKIRLTYSLNI